MELPGIYSLQEATDKYDWEVNLCNFRSKMKYPGFFDQQILPADITQFEDAFRAAIDNGNPFQRAGEVCFWENYRRAGHQHTEKLLKHLSPPENWLKFCEIVKESSQKPSWENFCMLQNACGQKEGFAVPITFLAFYNPVKYPMVDRRVAKWWNTNKPKGRTSFVLRNNLIPPRKNNWNVYLEWKSFVLDTQKNAKNGEQEM